MRHDPSSRPDRALRGSRTLLTLASAAILMLAVSAAGAPAAVAVAPSNTTPPSVTGTAEVDGSVTASPGTWAGTAPLTFAYAWLSCDAGGNGCAAIPGATAVTYSPKAADLGRTLRVRVVATNTEGSASATSTAVTVGAPKAPRNTASPVIHASSATFKVGDLVAAAVGSWLGATPIAYTYQWTRCDQREENCGPIPGATKSTYVISAADLGRPIFVQVKAINSFGTAFKNSAKTPAAVSLALFQAARPTIAGSPTVGSTLTANPGIWLSGQPVNYTYQWTRCEATGPACSPIPDAKRATYALTGSDLGRQLFVQIKAISGQAFLFGNSLRTRTIATTVPGTSTTPVSAVTLPNRLVISEVKFQPTTITSRSPFSARFRVTDLSGKPVQGALVYALGIPYSWATRAPEVPTDADGWATMQIAPTAELPLRRGTALVIFVRTRKPGENLLAGVSSRRLVQIVVR